MVDAAIVANSIAIRLKSILDGATQECVQAQRMRKRGEIDNAGKIHQKSRGKKDVVLL